LAHRGRQGRPHHQAPSLRQLQEQWAAKIGRERFSDFKDVAEGLSMEETQARSE